MTMEEAIQYLEWLSNIDFSKKYPTYPMVTNPEQVEALQMAISALQELDKNQTKPNNLNDGVENANLTQSNGIESKVKGVTACRVPEVAKDTNVPSKDTISRQAAIDAVRENTFRLTFAEEQNCEGHVAWSAEAVYSDVIEGALLELPSAQPVDKDIHAPCNDTISRAAAIDAVSDALKGTFVEYEAIARGIIGKLPSAQPEIIRCRDCKYYREYGYVNGKPKFLPKCTFSSIYVNADDFCSRVERRTDEQV